MNVTFAGGGTGGHLYPAIAIADALVQRGLTQPDDIEFIGTRDRLEAHIVPAAGFALGFVRARPLLGRGPIERLKTATDNAAGIAAALVLLLKHKPDLLIASGGYVCFPVVVAARMLRALHLLKCAIVLLEINAQPGRTNRLLAPLVDEVWGADSGAPRSFRTKYCPTGVPVRRSLTALPERSAAAARLGVDSGKQTLFVMGGSQGARSINDAVADLVSRAGLPWKWQLVHLCGSDDYERIVRAYQRSDLAGSSAVLPFLGDPADAYACADVALTRAGAGTLAELAAVGLPAILVPYPHASEDHQRINARRFEAVGAALVIDDAALDAGSLGRALQAISDPATLERMRRAMRTLSNPQALERILARVRALTGAV